MANRSVDESRGEWELGREGAVADDAEVVGLWRREETDDALADAGGSMGFRALARLTGALYSHVLPREMHFEQGY